MLRIEYRMPTTTYAHNMHPCMRIGATHGTAVIFKVSKALEDAKCCRPEHVASIPWD